MKHCKILSLILSLCLVFGMLSVVAGAETVEQKDVVYFGNTQWVELEDGRLLAADVMEQIPFDASGLNDAWEGSDAQAWCEEYAAELFEGEQAVVESVEFLSKDDAEKLSSAMLKASAGWWLSTAYGTAEEKFVCAVSDAGLVGHLHVAKNHGVRPVIALDTGKIVLKSELYKNTEMGLVSENASGQYKLTVQSNAYAGFAVSSISAEGRTVSVTFSGAATGSKEQVSAAVMSTSGALLAYGPISKGVASDTVSFEIPQEISGNLVIGVFNEQVNGGNITDYASAMTSETVTVQDGYGYVEMWNINLNDAISANFVMNIQTEDQNAVVKTTVNGVVTETPVSQVKENGNVVTVNVAAAQMTDMISVQVVDSNGVGGTVQNYSVRDYADYLLANSTNESEIALVKAMLNYGGKSQTYFGYNLNKLANAGILFNETAPTNSGAAPKISGSAEGIVFYGASVVAQSKTEVRFYFSTSEDISGYTFKVSGVAVEAVAKDGMYYVAVAGIFPNELAEEITVSVNDSLSVSYSPLTYVERMYNKQSNSAALKEFVCAIYSYYLAAAEYVSV